MVNLIRTNRRYTKMRLPMTLKLRTSMHKNMDYSQDIIVNELCNLFPNAIIHGGTAIWKFSTS